MYNKFEILVLLFAIIATVCSSPMSLESPTNLMDGRILGGREVSIVKHPHHCSLRYRSCNLCDFSHLCGASIYTSEILITAAHCTRGRQAESFVAVCGTENRRGGDGAIVPVKSHKMHEAYNASSTDNDVAIIFLTTPLPINNVTIAAIALSDEHPKGGVKSLVTGWGTTTEGGFNSNKLLEVEVKIVSNAECDKAYGGDRITAAMLCAGVLGGGKDACQGDSGGPLVVNHALAGVVSWGRGCGRPGLPGVYASVAYFRDWIEETVAKNN